MSNNPYKNWRFNGIDRRQFLLAGMTGFSALGLTGCGRMLRRGQSPDELPLSETELESTNADIYIRDLTSVWGLNDFKVHGVALVTQLHGTGSDPGPSSQRTMLMGEMKTHQVPEPKSLLADKNTSMVVVEGYLPPAIRKGERFDINVLTMPRSETTSLEHGYMLQARLRKMEVLGGRVAKGHVDALAMGSIVVDSIFDDTDPMSARRGRIYGGGMAKKTRTVGLAVRPDSRSIQAATRISRQINERLHTIDNGGKAGVATPMDDQVIELVVPERYKNNVWRYMGVVSNIIYRESTDLVTRIDRLEKELLEPALASRAALRLEAIGKESINSLNRGARSEDAEVQFYAAESLAYLGESNAAKILGRLAMEEPAFRWRAMAALSTMDDLDAGIALSNLLHTPSAETRYGAFRSLYARSSADPAIHQEDLPKADFAYHVIPTNKQPMVHFARNRRSEIVLFGHDQRVADNFLFVDSGLTVKADNGALSITQFKRNGEDERIECSTTIDDLVRNLSGLGYGYGDLLKVLRKAKSNDALESRLVIDATPKSNRVYDRESESANAPQRFVKGPVPQLFRDAAADAEEKSKVRQATHEEDYDPAIDGMADDEPKKLGPIRNAMKNVFRK